MNLFPLLIAGVIASGPEAAPRRRLPALPDKEGFAGSFAGVSNNALLVAGGANFPDKKPWQGGKKVWYDTVFALDQADGRWRIVGKLPRPTGYRVSVVHRNGVICVGGSDTDRHYADAFRLEWTGKTLIQTNLPPLPTRVANCCGALVDNTLYVAGGLQNPDSKETLASAWSIDLAQGDARWQTLEPCPGGERVLAVGVGFQGAFWMLGGVDLFVGPNGKATRRYLTDAYRYRRGEGWRRLADLPRPVVAAPSPAPIDSSAFYLLGGDDGSQVDLPPERHRGFPKGILRYDPKTDHWSPAGELPAAPVAVPCVQWNRLWIIPGGETRPGIRTPEIWSFWPTKE